MRRELFHQAVGFLVAVVFWSFHAHAGQPGQRDAALPTALLERGIRGYLAEWPNAFVAGVVESVGSPECHEKNGRSMCRTKMRIMDLLAARPSPQITEFYLLSGPESRVGGSTAERVLVFAVPMPELGDTYGATYMASGTDEQAVEQLRGILKARTDE